MRRMFTVLILMFALNGIAAPIDVVTSTTDLAWLAKQIGQNHIQVSSLLKGTENPHYADAVPEFIRLASNAKIVCVVGLELEVGWMPKVLTRSGNAQVQPGGKGYCDTSKAVEVLEKPVGGVDRSLGDVHPAGNPHFWLSPKHFAQAAKAVTDALVEIDSSHATDYLAQSKKITAELEAVVTRNKKKLDPVLEMQKKGPLLIEYHKEFSYFFNVYGLKSLGSIEEKPGVTPSAGRLVEIAMSAKAAGVKLAVASENAPKQTLVRFTELSGIPVVQLPMSLQPKNGLHSYEVLQDRLVDAVAGLAKGGH